MRSVDFRVSDEQALLRRTVREFAEAEIRPHVMEWDEAQQFPASLLPKLKSGRTSWSGTRRRPFHWKPSASSVS